MTGVTCRDRGPDEAGPINPPGHRGTWPSSIFFRIRGPNRSGGTNHFVHKAS